MEYKLFQDKRLITNNFHYSSDKYLMTDMVGSFHQNKLVGFIAYNKIQDSIFILFAEVLEAYRGLGLCKQMVKYLNEEGIITESSKIRVFAETYEGYRLFTRLVELGLLPDDTDIGGLFNASICGEGSIQSNTYRP
jgi:hypothetical protein